MDAEDLAVGIELDLALQHTLDLADPTLRVGDPGVSFLGIPLQLATPLEINRF